MATAKPILNTKYLPKDGQYSIVIRLINGKQQKIHSTGERTKEEYWQDGQVSKKHPEASRINSVIDAELSKAKTYFADCRINNIPIDLNLAYSEVKSYNFTEYLRRRKKLHEQKDEIEMFDKISRFIKEFDACYNRDIYFSELNEFTLSAYDVYLKGNGNCNNTRYKKFEFLGKYYNGAASQQRQNIDNPFYEYKKKIKQEPSQKEKLTHEQLLALEKLPLRNGLLCLARDIFLFSYYCKGIRFETCITMKKSAIANGRLNFQINKGKLFLSAEIHPMLKEIIDRYIDNDTDTIFGRLNTAQLIGGRAKKSKLGSENSMLNLRLKKIAEIAGIPIELSMHHSRHTFAYHLKYITESIHQIKDSLGHSGTHVTERYLKDLDDQYLDSKLRPLYERASG